MVNVAGPGPSLPVTRPEPPGAPSMVRTSDVVMTLQQCDIIHIAELDNLMTKLSKFEIEGVREVDAPLFSGAPHIPLGELERLDKETPIEAQVS